MLQIYLYGPLFEGFLDINPNTELDIEDLAEIFDEDLSTGLYSLPVELPWTDNNRKLFGFAERLQNFNSSVKQYRCDVYDNGFPELTNAQLTILERSGLFSYKRGSFNASIAGTKGLFGSTIKNKTLQNLKLDGTITWSGKDSREFANDVMHGNEPDYPYLAFAPVAIEGFIDTGRTDYTTEFLAKDTVNYLMLNNGPDYFFGRPQSGNPALPAISGTEEYVDFFTVPFFKLKYILKKIFQENGYTVTGSFVDSTDFDDLVIFNNYGIEHYVSYVDINRSIYPSNHLPKIEIKEFLKAIFGLFNIYPVFSGTNTVQLVYRKQAIINRNILSLNEVCSKQFTATTESDTSESGYKLNYTWDSNDGYYSDRVKDLKDKNLVATVAKFSDLANLNLNQQLTTDDIVYVQADNLYYRVANALNNPILWDAYAEKLEEYTDGKGERSLSPEISTLCTYVEYDTNDALYEKRNYVGTRQLGSYRNNKGTVVLNDFALRIFYIKHLPIGGGYTVPVSFSHNRDKDNNIVEKYSLSWHGEDGLATNFHKLWQQVKENNDVVKTELKADQKLLGELQAYNIYEINNVLYLPYKIERKIPLNGKLTISLTPL